MEMVGPIMMASLFCDAGRSTAGYNLKIRHAKSELRTLNLQKWYKHYFSCFFRPRVKAQRTSARIRRLPTTLDGHHASPPPTHHHQIAVRASSPLLVLPPFSRSFVQARTPVEGFDRPRAMQWRDRVLGICVPSLD
jgi:hypothetical protein